LVSRSRWIDAADCTARQDQCCPEVEQPHERREVMAAKLERTATPGIYRRGSRYVVIWTHRGQQHKEAFRTLAEAREAKGRRQAGEKRPVAKVGFLEYYEQWIESYAGRTARGFSETTRPEYRRSIETYGKPRWKTWRLADVEPADVRDLFGKMRTDGESTSQIVKLRAALSAMFATAVDDGLLRSNPVQGIRIPAASGDEPVDDKPKALTRGDLRILLSAIPENWRLFFELLAHTGLRISEAIGLTWEHLELGGDHPRLLVREQVYRGKRRKLKSGTGRRDIPLSPGMASRLLARRRDQYKGPKSPVFASSVGTTLIRGKVAERVLNPSAIGVGMYEEVPTGEGDKTRKRPTVSFHTFRHTCASLLFAEGRNVKQVQEWLGHADPAFTLRTYVHLMDDGVGDATFFDELVVGGAAAEVAAV
jgi:integrase